LTRSGGGGRHPAELRALLAPVVVVTALLAGCALEEPMAPPSPSSGAKGIAGDAEHAALAASLRSSVDALAAGFGPRPGTDPARLRQVAEWISARLQAAGCAPRLSPFEVETHTYWNVLCEVPGTASAAPARPRAAAGGPETAEGPAAAAGPTPAGGGILVGAHYDTEPGTPGADDNASGVAAALELAARFARRPAPARLRFAFFALEEMPYFASRAMGSAALAESLAAAGDLPDGMLSLEMLGYFSDAPGSQLFPYRYFRWLFPERGNFIAFVGDLGSRALNRRLHGGFSRACAVPAERLSAPAFVPGVDFSDHRSFAAAGVPAVMVTDTAFYRNPHYHAASDLPETLDYGRMAGVVVGLEAALRSF